jgi:hypothetical protein
MLFKVACGKEIHIINPKDKTNFAEFKKSIAIVFKKLPNKYNLTYLDEDADEITLTNEADFNILLQTGLKNAKIFVKEISEEFYDETQQVVIEPEEIKP